MEAVVPEVAFGNLTRVCDEDVVLYDGYSEAQAGVDEKDDHEDVVEDSIPVGVRAACHDKLLRTQRRSIVSYMKAEK